jgi:GTP cyclohydrolase I
LIDKDKIQAAIASIIDAIGEDPAREGLADTPARVAEMYGELFSGLHRDPVKALATGFEEGHKELVVLKNISFFSICEHHLLPFFGVAHVGYIPSGRLVGASKLARALDILGRRPQLQERLTSELVDAISSAIQPQGVAAVLEAEHMCISLRGVNKRDSKFVTSASRGTLRTQRAARQEFLSLLPGRSP